MATSDFSSLFQLLEELGILDMLEQILADSSSQIIVSLVTALLGVLAEAGFLAIGVAIGIITTVVTVVVNFIISLFLYILGSIGLANIGKKLNVRHRILAWIPFARIYYIGKCAQTYLVRSGKKKIAWGWILLGVYFVCKFGEGIVSSILNIVATFVPAVGIIGSILPMLLTLAYLGILCYCSYLICRNYMGVGGSVVWTIITLIFNEYVGLVYFILGFFKVKPVESAAAKASDDPEALEPDRVE